MTLSYCGSIALTLILCGTALKADERRDLSLILEPIVRQHDVPGMVAAVVKGDNVVAIGAAGVRRRGGDEKIRITDQFHLGSCTKSMTATLCAMLVEEGKLSWETTISDVFPELKETMRPAWRNVTLRQLLNHCGGMPEDLDQDGLWEKLWAQRDPAPARQMLLIGVLSHEPAAKPGTKFIYSNAGYAVVGHMAEQVMHKPWEQLVRERLFKPLKMTSAGFGAPGKAGAVIEPWGHKERGEPIEPGPDADNPVAIGPAGTVHCSIEDWAKYIALHLRGDEGDAKLLKTDTFRVLHTPPKGADYAMGWGVAERQWAGGTALTHAGSNTMWYAVTWLAPCRNFAVVICCNQGGDEAAKACDDAAAKLVTDPQFNSAH
jgi:CubicO group peptidase (beta-lactamase class C family)